MVDWWGWNFRLSHSASFHWPELCHMWMQFSLPRLLSGWPVKRNINRLSLRYWNKNVNRQTRCKTKKIVKQKDKILLSGWPVKGNIKRLRFSYWNKQLRQAHRKTLGQKDRKIEKQKEKHIGWRKDRAMERMERRKAGPERPKI